LKKNEKFDKDDRKVNALMHHCVDCQSAYEESAEEVEKDNK